MLWSFTSPFSVQIMSCLWASDTPIKLANSPSNKHSNHRVCKMLLEQRQKCGQSNKKYTTWVAVQFTDVLNSRRSNFVQSCRLAWFEVPWALPKIWNTKCATLMLNNFELTGCFWNKQIKKKYGKIHDADVWCPPPSVEKTKVSDHERTSTFYFH